MKYLITTLNHFRWLSALVALIKTIYATVPCVSGTCFIIAYSGRRIVPGRTLPQ